VIQRNWSNSVDQTLRTRNERLTTELRMEMYVKEYNKTKKIRYKNKTKEWTTRTENPINVSV
jgi:hypothetical protein